MKKGEDGIDKIETKEANQYSLYNSYFKYKKELKYNHKKILNLLGLSESEFSKLHKKYGKINLKENKMNKKQILENYIKRIVESEISIKKLESEINKNLKNDDENKLYRTKSELSSSGNNIYIKPKLVKDANATKKEWEIIERIINSMGYKYGNNSGVWKELIKK